MIPTVSQIQTVVADVFLISARDMSAPVKARNVARPRQVAMYLARRLTGRSLPQIAHQFRRHHTTVMYAERNVPKMIMGDPILLSRVDEAAMRLLGVFDAAESFPQNRPPENVHLF